MRAKEVHNCGRCGFCLVTCPVYRTELDESVSPRGKVQLIRHYAENGLPSSERLKDIVGHCLMCGSCTANCPSGVRHDTLFMRMRSRMIDDHGLGWKNKVLFHLLSHSDQLRLAARFSRLGRQGLLDHMLGEARLGHIRFRRLPRFNAEPFTETVRGLEKAGFGSARKVLYFVGCATNYVYGGVGRSIVDILSAMGLEVVFPERQVCCGLPIFSQGGLTRARDNIVRNIEMLDRDDIDAVITDCATCTTALSKGYVSVLDELGMDTAAARRVAGKVWEISSFLVDQREKVAPMLRPLPDGPTVTCHRPCHLRNAPVRADRTEELLQMIPGLTYRPAADKDACCGGGGTFFYEHPEAARKMAESKTANARATEAVFWATGCPGCRVNLDGSLEDRDRIVVVHPVELMARALPQG